jgi:hypothetical protein
VRWFGLIALFALGCDPHYQCACPDVQAALLVHVLDAASKLPVANPSFSENATALTAYCDDASLPDAGSACATWRIAMSGHHVVTVSAPNYSPQMLTVDIAPGSGGCCSHGQQLEETVNLSRS